MVVQRPSNASSSVAEQQLSADRRRGARSQTVFLVARVQTHDDQGLGRIRNISDGGIRLTVGIDVAIGDSLEVSPTDTFALRGRVVWASAGECGVELDQSIDSAEALRICAEASRLRNVRAPRLRTAHPVVVASDRGLRVTQLCDISQRGMKITDDGSLNPGQLVTIMINRTSERKGYVRWVRDGFAGVILADPFRVEELGSVKKL